MAIKTTVLPDTLQSNGNAFDLSDETFGELRDANSLLGNMAAIHERFAEDGYLLFRNYLDKDKVLAGRRELIGRLDSIGLIDRAKPFMESIFSGDTSGITASDRKEFARNLRSGPALKDICFSGRIMSFFEQYFGDEVLNLNYIWVRNRRRGAATPCHFDWVYMGRGTRNVMTAWIPQGAVPLCDGPLAILHGSHKWQELQQTYGNIDVDKDKEKNPYGGGSLTKNPNEPQQRYGGRWLTTEFEPGDVLLFGMFTLHCSLDNESPENRIRLSTDTRYQLASEPADERWIGDDPFGHGMM